MKKLIFLFSLIGVFWSCSDELDVTPSDIIDASNAYETKADFELGARGLYERFSGSGYYGANSATVSKYFMGDLFSDNVILAIEGRQSRRAYYEWDFSSGVSTTGFFLDAYQVIQAANLLIESSSILEEGDFKNRILGEAYASRAIAHFDLVTLYGKSYQEASSNDLGVAYVTTTDAGAKPARETVFSNYEKILQDLTMAESMIGMENNNSRLNQRSVNAYLAKVYLTQGEYQKAISASEKVESLGGSVASLSEFPAVWDDASEEGVLFKIKIDESDDVSLGVAWNQTGGGEVRSEYVCSYPLYLLYNDTDVRKDAYIETSAYSGKLYNHIIKHNGKLSGSANVVDAKVIRYAEVLLIKAESYYELGNEGAALEALNTLRKQRYMGYTDGTETGQDLFDAIQLERRLELAFEGDRFFTLKRLNEPVIRSSYGDLADGSGTPPINKVLEADSHKFQMAYSISELEANPNAEQNPGY